MTRRIALPRVLAAAGAAAAAAALVPAASAIPFGANLNRPANNTFGCETGGIIANPFAPGQLITTPSGHTNCTWTANGRLGDFAETLAVPASGTVTQIQVKVGPTVGPMRVVSYSALAKFPIVLNQPPACCQIRGQSQVFTPAPNGVTTVNVNLPVITEKVPPPGGDIIRTDFIGLSVLVPNVPIPAHNTGNFDALQGAPVGGSWFPQATAGQERLAPGGLVGFQLLLRGELTPAGAAGGAGGPGGSGAGSSGSSSSGQCLGRKGTVVGTNKSETLRGTAKRDVFVGKGGNDRIIGGRGNDIACGGPGKDTLLGGPGNDILLGDAGNDIARGGSGNDLLRGGGQNDRLFGNGGNDRLFGNTGNDRLFGNTGNDRLFGNTGRDILAGAGGNDRLDGGPGARDRNLGGPGKDRCLRGARVAC